MPCPQVQPFRPWVVPKNLIRPACHEGMAEPGTTDLVSRYVVLWVGVFSSFPLRRYCVHHGLGSSKPTTGVLELV